MIPPLNRFIVTEIRRSIRSTGAILAVLSIGLVGPILTDVLRTSVLAFLKENARHVLTADIAVSAFRPITDEELEKVGRRFKVDRTTREVEFVSMVAGREAKSLLLEVHAVDADFPLIGQFEFESKMQVEKPKLSSGEVWLSRDAATALGYKQGDELKIGRAAFRIAHILTGMPGMSRTAFGLAPRAYVPRQGIEATGLFGFGSQVQHRAYFTFNGDMAVGEAEIKSVLPDPDLFVRTPDDSTQGIERFTQSVSLYLALVSVCLFAMGWLAAFYIIRVQAIQRVQRAAVALVFGASDRMLVWLELARVILMTLLASFVALAFVETILVPLEPWLARQILTQIALPFHLRTSWITVGLLLAVSLASGFLFTLPFAVRLRSARLVQLFSESAVQEDHGGDSRASDRALWSVLGVGLLALLFAVAVRLTGDSLRGLQITGLLAVVTVILLVVGTWLFRGIGILGQRFTRFRVLGLQLSRSRFVVRLSFMAIAFSTFVTVAIGQTMLSLGSEFRESVRVETLPDFFAFNIPEAEVEALSAWSEKRGLKFEHLSPMILARLTKKNDRPMQGDRFERFPVRVTWREKLLASETLVEGEPLPTRFNADDQRLPYLSVESRFAEQNGLHLGDRLEFDVQGVPMVAEIRNFRRVRWTDFNPNFFISFQAGVLEDAPKTWLANLRVPDRTARAQVQAELVRGFPDLSVIDVGQTLERVMGVVRAVLGPAEGAAMVTSLFSLLVLASIVGHSTELRAREMNLLRILGAEPRRVRSLYRSEFIVAGFLGALVGGGLGVAGTAWLLSRFFELSPSFDLVRLGLAMLIPTMAMAAIGDWLYFRVARGLGFVGRVV